MSAITNRRSQVAVAARRHKRKNTAQTAEDLALARKELATANIEAYVARALERSGPLTEEQRSKLAGLLSPLGVAAR